MRELAARVDAARPAIRPAATASAANGHAGRPGAALHAEGRCAVCAAAVRLGLVAGVVPRHLRSPVLAPGIRDELTRTYLAARNRRTP
jgi:hypothetical protein